MQPSVTAGPTVAGANRPIPSAVGGDTGADITSGVGVGAGPGGVVSSTVRSVTSTRII